MAFHKRQLGDADLFVSELGLGTMSFKTKADTIEIIRYAVDRGINFIDTADLYRFGEIETWLGQALKGIRDKVILATKGGNHWKKGANDWFWDPSKNYIKSALKDSLKRLKTDYIDLYQLHGGTINDPIDETIEAFEELKSEGLIRYYGISSIRPNVIKEYVKRSQIVSVMLPYSLLDRRGEEEILTLLKEKRISVIARGPLAKGALTTNGENKIPEAGFLDYKADEIINLRAEIKLMRDRSLTETALRYPLAHPAVATVIPGASTLTQLEEIITSAAVSPLTRDEIKFIRQHTKANRFKKHR